MLSAARKPVDRAAKQRTKKLVENEVHQSAFIARRNSGDFYQAQGISVTPLMGQTKEITYSRYVRHQESRRHRRLVNVAKVG